MVDRTITHRKENSMLHKVNLLNAVNSVEELYRYHKTGVLNQDILSVVQVENRTLDFHVHEGSDELFYVIEGGFWLELEDGLLRVDSNEFVIVPKGVLHRPVVKEKTKFLMIELEGTLNKQNSGELYEST